MRDASVLVARPQHARQLVLLFHGVGSSAAGLAPVGEAMARAMPDAMVVSVDAPHASTLGCGREWFSVVGITEQNRPERIAEAMPLFLDTVAYWQRSSGIGPGRTILVGFSQGAIMSLEATQVDAPPAGTVVALAGRFAQGVRRAHSVAVHLIHGEQDKVVPARWSIEAAAALRALGGRVTLDLVPGLAHGIDSPALQLALNHLASPQA